jgi:molecular chaperone HscB
MICWKCKEANQAPVCVSCGAIQPPMQKDFYAVFGIERRYFISEDEVEKAYRRLSRILHPDRWRSKPAIERRFSLQWTAFLNEARKGLLDSVTRARYLATGSVKPSEKSGKISQQFLQTIFNLQMDAMDRPAEVKVETEARQNENNKKIEEVFQKWEAETGDLSEIEELLGRWKYLSNLLEKL